MNKQEVQMIKETFDLTNHTDGFKYEMSEGLERNSILYQEVQ